MTSRYPNWLVIEQQYFVRSSNKKIRAAVATLHLIKINIKQMHHPYIQLNSHSWLSELNEFNIPLTNVIDSLLVLPMITSTKFELL